MLLRNFPFVGGRLTVLTRFRERAIRSYRTIDRVGPSTGQSTRSCRAIQGGFLLLAMLCSYLVSDTWPLPSLSRSTGYGLVVTLPAVVLYKRPIVTSHQYLQRAHRSVRVSSRLSTTSQAALPHSTLGWQRRTHLEESATQSRNCSGNSNSN